MRLDFRDVRDRVRLDLSFQFLKCIIHDGFSFGVVAQSEIRHVRQASSVICGCQRKNYAFR